MASISVLNRIAKSTYTKMESLKIGKEYAVTKFDIYEDTVYKKGNMIQAHLETGGYVILPVRFNQLFEDDEDLTSLNQQKLFLIYRGKKGQSHDIEFKQQGQKDDNNGDDDK